MVITDKQIVETLKQQPEAGFRQLMTRYREPIYWHIRRLVVRHDDAQDVAQETFVRVFRSLHQYRADCSLRSWIYQIATNEACGASANGAKRWCRWKAKPPMWDE